MFGQMSEINKKPLHVPRNTTTPQYGFVHSGGPAAQIVLMNIKQVLRAARYVITRGWKKLEKIMLCTSAPSVVVAGYKDQLDKILRLADLPKYENLAQMDDKDYAEQMSTPEPDLLKILSTPTPDAVFSYLEIEWDMSPVRADSAIAGFIYHSWMQLSTS